tara:strand:- start:399 stop:968 length:570 start_codon:yes stop_codon:yes gene_type:complete
MSLKNYIKVYQIIEDPKIVSKCIRFLSKKSKDSKYLAGSLWNGKGSYEDKKVRDVEILPLSNFSESLTTVHWANFLSYFILQGMKKYSTEFPDIRSATINEIQGLRYEKGGHYKFHVDDGPGMNRKYSSILILNNDYEGGELCFKIDDKEETIKNVPGSLVVWPSNFMFPHMVKPIKKGVRYSIVSWMS